MISSLLLIIIQSNKNRVIQQLIQQQNHQEKNKMIKEGQRTKRLASPTLRQYMIDYTLKKKKKMMNEQNAPENATLAAANLVLLKKISEFQCLIEKSIKDDTLKNKFKQKLKEIHNITEKIHQKEGLSYTFKPPESSLDGTRSYQNMAMVPQMVQRFQTSNYEEKDLSQITNQKKQKLSTVKSCKKFERRDQSYFPEQEMIVNLKSSHSGATSNVFDKNLLANNFDSKFLHTSKSLYVESEINNVYEKKAAIIRNR